MKVRLYSVRDDKAQLATPPVVMQNDAIATRSFGDLVTNGKESQYSLHPEDFSLWFIGEFDNEKLSLEKVVPIKLAQASDFVASNK